MPRDGAGVYSTPAGTHGVPGNTIYSANYNTNVDDVANDLNTPRPIVAGGTGASSPSAACSNIGAVAKTGDTMTGTLTLTGTNAFIFLDKTASGGNSLIQSRTATKSRWNLALGDSAAETGSNTGSNFRITRSDDIGNPIDDPLTINRASGQATFSQAITVSPSAGVFPKLTLNKSGASDEAQILGTKGSTLRWVMDIGDGASESGSNAGSNFAIYRFSDGGSFIDSPLAISRASGQATFSQQINLFPPLSAPAGGSAFFKMNKAASGGFNMILGQTNGSERWRMSLGNNNAESGSNAGSDFTLERANDSGSIVDAPLTVNRASGTVAIPLCTHGTNAIAAPNTALAIGFTGGGTQYGITFRSSIDGTRMLNFHNSAGTEIGSISASGANVNYNTSSDGRLKTNIEPIDAGSTIDAINAVRFNWKSTGEIGHGVIAQEAQAILPEAVVHDEERDTWGTDYSKFVPLLLAEVKALRARVAALESR